MGNVCVPLAAGHAWAGVFWVSCACHASPSVPVSLLCHLLPQLQPDASRRGSYGKLSCGVFNRAEPSAMSPVVCAFKIQKFKETRAFILRTCILLQKSELIISSVVGSDLCPAVSLSRLGTATETAQEQHEVG